MQSNIRDVCCSSAASLVIESSSLALNFSPMPYTITFPPPNPPVVVPFNVDSYRLGRFYASFPSPPPPPPSSPLPAALRPRSLCVPPFLSSPSTPPPHPPHSLFFLACLSHLRVSRIHSKHSVAFCTHVHEDHLVGIRCRSPCEWHPPSSSSVTLHPMPAHSPARSTAHTSHGCF